MIHLTTFVDFKNYSSELIIFWFGAFCTKKKWILQRQQKILTINTSTLRLKCWNNFCLSVKTAKIFEKNDFHVKKWKKWKKNLWPSFTRKIFFYPLGRTIYFSSQDNILSHLSNKNPGIPSFTKICWFLGIFTSRKPAVFGLSGFWPPWPPLALRQTLTDFLFEFRRFMVKSVCR